MSTSWQVGDWTYAPDRRALLRSGEELRLEPKTAAVLERLLEDPGRVVTKGQLFDAVWPGVHVTEEVLPNAVYQLRRALGDDARAPRYVETVPKAGYRLVALARPLPEAAASAAPAAALPGRRRPSALASGPLLLVAALLALAVGIARAPRAAHEGDIGAGVPVDAALLVARGFDALDSALPGAGREAAALARVAVASTPGSADAHALEGAAWCARSAAGEVSARDGYRRARAAATRALALAPGHPRALRARAQARWLGEWDWRGAEADLRTAVAAAPGEPGARAALAQLLALSGRLAEARRQAAGAVATASHSIPARLAAGLVASLDGRPGLAGRHYRAVLEIHPGHPVAAAHLAKERAPARQRPEDERLAALAAKERVRPGHVALWMAEADRPEEAFDWLERAVAERDPTLLFFRFDPRWDRWRSHPRYREAMRAAGLS